MTKFVNLCIHVSILPFNLWCANFLKAQGCHVTGEDLNANNQQKMKFTGHRNILFQDNASSIRLETNRKASSTKRTRHLNVRCFPVTDKLKNGDVSTMECCPTGDMLADVLTKPLQGSLFRKFGNAIMGCTDAECIRHKLDCDKVHARDPGQLT